MEQKLYNNLIKVAVKADHPEVYPDSLLRLTMATLEAIRAHILACYPGGEHSINILEDAIEVVKGYQ